MPTNRTNYTSRRRRVSTANRSYGRNMNMTIFEYSAKMGKVSSFISIGLFLLVLGMLYLSSASQPAAYGSEIRNIDLEIAELELKKADLEVENARLTSLKSIEKSEIAKAMVKPKSVQYAE